MIPIKGILRVNVEKKGSCGYVYTHIYIHTHTHIYKYIYAYTYIKINYILTYIINILHK